MRTPSGGTFLYLFSMDRDIVDNWSCAVLCAWYSIINLEIFPKMVV